MSPLHQIEPRWVLVNSTLHNVSEFAHLSPTSRPSAICPVCQEVVILKLGRKNAHHYAHQSNNLCISTHPETALHLNTKFYIYNQLLQTKSLIIEEKCAGFCGNQREYQWACNWIDVKVEYVFDSYRPDIALIHSNYTIQAIEVFVTHAVDDQKASYFAEQGIPWLEVRANENLYTGDNAWTTEKPLPYIRYHPRSYNWTCDACMAREKEEAKRREHLFKNFESIYSAKMVDFYFRSGKKYREGYFAVKKVQNGELIEAWIETENSKILAIEKAPITDESRRRLNDAVKKRIAEFRDKGAIVDEFMKWQPWEKGKRFVVRDTERFPFRYMWNDKPRKWFFIL